MFKTVLDILGFCTKFKILKRSVLHLTIQNVKNVSSLELATFTVSGIATFTVSIENSNTINSLNSLPYWIRDWTQSGF